ncbi:hypothetical protein DPEC_G00112360 [Dallia pectoralis]|uniref:Uncharacterized protein n=1 Tax=Dallia pectoralis TaxID=75939 RepID=A0ACC2GTB1_DALPE|nr:hypothetical protein DPEC_G00112360 [Dallia pectoralis]
MTWPAELKPNTALNHRGVVDGAMVRKGVWNQRTVSSTQPVPVFMDGIPGQIRPTSPVGRRGPRSLSRHKNVRHGVPSPSDW